MRIYLPESDIDGLRRYRGFKNPPGKAGFLLSERYLVARTVRARYMRSACLAGPIRRRSLGRTLDSASEGQRSSHAGSEGVNSLLALTIVGLIIAAARFVVAYLAWRYPRAAPVPCPDASTADQAKDEGLALFLAFLLAVRERRMSRAEKR